MTKPEKKIEFNEFDLKRFDLTRKYDDDFSPADGLAWRDQHSFGLDYAETLKQWRENFDAAAATGRLPAQFDQRFIDLWRYYLMYCEGGFRGGGIDVAQVTLVRN